MSDLISREAIEKIIVEMLEKWSDGYCYIEIPTNDAIKEMKSAINNAPTVEQDTLITEIIEELESRKDYGAEYAQAMEDVIVILKAKYGHNEERPQGEWTDTYWEDAYQQYFHTCSICKKEIEKTCYDNFCPNCGAKMKGEK